MKNISYKLGLLLFMSQSQSEGDIQVYCASHQRCDHCNGHMASQLCDIIIESFHLLTSFVNTFCKTLEFEIMHYINIFFSRGSVWQKRRRQLWSIKGCENIVSRKESWKSQYRKWINCNLKQSSTKKNSQFTNLEHITMSESRLRIKFKISTKHQHLD